MLFVCLLCPSQGLLKLQNVQGPGDIGLGRSPLQTAIVRAEEMVKIRQGLTQLIEQLAQIGMSLPFGRIRPKQESKVRAILWSVAMQYKIGQQGLLAWYREAC